MIGGTFEVCIFVFCTPNVVFQNGLAIERVSLEEEEIIENCQRVAIAIRAGPRAVQNLRRDEFRYTNSNLTFIRIKVDIVIINDQGIPSIRIDFAW